MYLHEKPTNELSGYVFLYTYWIQELLITLLCFYFVNKNHKSFSFLFLWAALGTNMGLCWLKRKDHKLFFARSFLVEFFFIMTLLWKLWWKIKHLTLFFWFGLCKNNNNKIKLFHFPDISTGENDTNSFQQLII